MSELSEIVGAIRQVESTLERRAGRAEGTFLTLWGFGVAATFLFYRAEHADPAPFAAVLGPLVPWMWLAPFAVCYALTLVLGAKYAPVSVSGRRLWQDPYAVTGLLVTAALVLAGRAVGHPEWSTAGIVVFGGVMLHVRLRSWGASARRLGLALAVASVPVGVVIFLSSTTLVSHAIAAAYWGIAWPLAGALVYARGR